MSSTGMTKRNIGLVLAYIGTRYHGLQMNAGFKTVEGEIFKALNAAEAISDSNYGDRHKIKWSSCSRTDKGVHAAALVCSTKLLIPTEEDRGIVNLGSLSQSRIDRWNTFLPDDIRIFKGVRLGKNQRAKSMCSAREYEYLVPATALQGKTVEELQRILHKFEGTHRFHNFCGRLSTKAKPNNKRKRANSSEEDEEDEEDEELELEGGDESSVSKERPPNASPSAHGLASAHSSGPERAEAAPGPEGGGAAQPFYGQGLREQTRKASTLEEWQWEVSQDARLTSQKYVRTLFGVVVSPEPIAIPIEGDSAQPPLSVFVVRLTAHSFAMHQIRKIMSLSLAVLAGHVPEWVVDVALNSNFLIHMPLAPSEALCLVNVSFWDDRVEEYRMEFGSETAQVMHAFKVERIYPHIAKRITAVPDDPKRPLPPFDEFWRRYANYRFPDESGWELLRTEFDRYKELKERVKEEMSRQPPPKPDSSWKKDLPQGLMTAICVKFRTLPGPHTAWIKTVLVKALYDGKIETPEEFKSKPEYLQVFLDYLDTNKLSPLDYDIPNRQPPAALSSS